MSPFTTSLVIFACLFSGALLGLALRVCLPSEHLSPDSKDVVRLAMGLVATTAALVLGLLVASAKGFYDTQNTEITQAAANIVLLDRILVHYGPETTEARALLRSAVDRMVDLSGQRDQSATTPLKSAEESNEAIFDKIQELAPKNDYQRTLQTHALGLAINLGQTRWLLFEQKTSSVPTTLLAVLVFWLTVLFMSFGMFAHPNATVVFSLFVSALALSGAIFLMLEMYQPYTGWIRVSDAPLRAALAHLQ